ncbi:1156_t:CDS:2, partial [Paraglomus brasilianum]
MPTERVSQSVTGEIPKAGKETIPIETIQRKVKERKEREEELKECERKQCEEERKKQEEAKSKATAEETDTKNQQEPKPNTTDLDREPSERKDTKHRPAKLDLSRTTSASVPSAPPNALGSARKIEDLNAVTYPPNITPPDPTLNQDAQPGKYKYDLPFLIQFMSFCKEKPDNLLHLDALRERVEVPKKKKKKQRTSESNKQGLSHNTSPAQSSYPPPPMGKFEKSITSEERFTQSSMQGRYSNSRIGPRTASKNPLLSDGWDTAGRKVDLTRFGQVRSTKISGTNMNLAPGSGTIARSASGSKDWRTNNKDREPVENKWQSSKSGGVVKSSSMSQEEAKRKIKAMVDEYWSVRDKKEVALCIKELPVGYFSDAIREFIESALEKKPDDVSSCADLLKELRKIYPADCKKAFTDIMDNLEDIGIDVPHAYAHTGQLLHGAQIKLNEVAELVRPLTYIGGSEPPSAKVVAAYLNSTKASMGEQMVLRQVKNARFDFASLFPDGNEDALNRFLEKQ